VAYGGSFGENLLNAGMNAGFDKLGEGFAGHIGDQHSANLLTDGQRDLAHAALGCGLGMVRSGNGKGCAAGAAGAVVAHSLAEDVKSELKDEDSTLSSIFKAVPGKTINENTVFITGLAGSVAGGVDGALAGDTTRDLQANMNMGQITGSNAVANNYLKHDENEKRLKAASACADGDKAACAERDRWNAIDKQRDADLKSACYGNGASAECSARYAALEVARESYVGKVESGAALADASAKGLYEYTASAEAASSKPLVNVPHYDKEGVARLAKVLRVMGEQGVDFTPILGDVKAFYEAETGFDYAIALVSVAPGIGDGAAKLLKEGRDLFKVGDMAGAAEKLGNANQLLHGVDIDPVRVADKLTELKSIPEVKNIHLVEAGSKGSWSKTANGKLDADSAYVLSNGHAYRTDASGRVNSVEGDLSGVTMDRNGYQQGCVGRSGGCTGDDGGHLIASALGGSGDRINMVPQAATLNRGDWKAMENQLRGFINEGKNVTMRVEVGYPPGGGARPNEFRVLATVDGEVIPFRFTQ
ncbi:DNA/RNA non-specific endonuclease, partial [Hydrogenophaga sp. 5NK40-0174]|uniref:DNA/RNA non-specific endonuclease n=1 Tax=Hydrogenophaga sp. 5NK40-0174 TaxID=3127649 RepID=UPI0033415713